MTPAPTPAPRPSTTVVTPPYLIQDAASANAAARCQGRRKYDAGDAAKDAKDAARATDAAKDAAKK